MGYHRVEKKSGNGNNKMLPITTSPHLCFTSNYSSHKIRMRKKVNLDYKVFDGPATELLKMQHQLFNHSLNVV